MEKVTISAQITPNPNTLKFVLDCLIIQAGSINFISAESAKGSPLAEKLYALEGVQGVMVGPNFVSVTKTYSHDWSQLAAPVTETIQTVLIEEETPVDVSLAKKQSESSGKSEIEHRIIEILDTEIRPAVAMDGGDIQFYSYEDGVVSLHLQGACSSCPSSTMTLKLGIENRLKEEFPEIVEVIQV